MSRFKKMRKTQEVDFNSETFTLMEPSVNARNSYLIAMQKASENGEFSTAQGEEKPIDFNLLAKNHELSLHLIAMCLWEDGYTNFDECLQDITSNTLEGFVELFYPVAEALTWPEAPAETPDPKADQANDSRTDSP